MKNMSSDVDEYVRMMRNQRMAQALAAQSAAPIDHDPRGFISGGQLLGKALTDINSRYYNNAADEDNAKSAIKKNAQVKAMFSQPAPEQLGAALGRNPMNIEGMSPEQSQYLYENNPKLWEQVQGQNLQTTEAMKNAAAGGQGRDYLAQMNRAKLEKEQGEASKSPYLNLAAGGTAYNTNTDRSFMGNRLENQDVGGSLNTVLIDPNKGKSTTISSTPKTLSPTQENPKLKQIPPQVNRAIIENAQAIKKVGDALSLLSGSKANGMMGDKNATGMKGYLPNVILNRVDASGAPTRAAVTDIGSLVLHDRSGAAVSASESPRLLPFIPLATDPPEVAVQKLKRFAAEYKLENEALSQMYNEEQGYKSSPLLNDVQNYEHISDDDRQALDWANANPNDPRAQAIKRLHGAP
jgi:hypothetical protein